jgi:hypothetical protein
VNEVETRTLTLIALLTGRNSDASSVSTCEARHRKSNALPCARLRHLEISRSLVWHRSREEDFQSSMSLGERDSKKQAASKQEEQLLKCHQKDRREGARKTWKVLDAGKLE